MIKQERGRVIIPIQIYNRALKNSQGQGTIEIVKRKIDENIWH
ncbi:MAG: hypothetical protein ACTSVV_03720 [Promethearchaeota archaeon]